jgi:hypothetical protein
MKPNERSNPVMRGFRKARSQKKILTILIAISLGLVLGISACQSSGDVTPESPQSAAADVVAQDNQEAAPPDEPAETTGEQSPEEPVEADQPEVEEVGTSDPQAILTNWGSSAHADTFILDEAGNNNTCARCHAPMVWLPSMDDMPESCFACKFEVSDPPPLISESDWVPIECIVCHEVDKKGNVNPEYTWLEIAQIEEYAEVASPTELCQKCHTESETPGHTFAHLGGAHTGYECTDCHDAHDTIASCSSSGCHEDVVNPETAIPGHDQDHVQVSCAACHDADTMTIDIDEQSGIWTTFAPDPAGGEALIQYVSHNTVLEAPCERCHFANNPWDLTNEIE